MKKTSSGLRVLVETVPSPVAAIYLWIDVGSADELPHQRGAAHFVEHMLFKGTSRRGVGEVALEIEGHGGDVNAYTGHDHTVVHSTVPASAWAETLDVLADMTLEPRFDAQEFELEREVILDEIRGGDDDAARALAEGVSAALFKKHPYGRPVIGKVRELRRLSSKAAQGFHGRFYRPANMLLSVAGPVSEGEVLAAAEQLFPGVDEGVDKPERKAEPPPARRRTALLVGRFDEPLVELAFRGVPRDHADAPALDILVGVLAGSPGSLLGTRLQLTGLATETWCASEQEPDDGSFLVGFSPLRGQTAACVQAAAALLAEVAAGRHLSFGRLHRSRNQLLAGRVFVQETVDGRAHSRAWYAMRSGHPEGHTQAQARLEAVTVADLRRVARKYLVSRRLVAGALVPEGDLDGAAFRAALDFPSLSPAPAEPPILRERLSCGATLLIEPLEHSGVAALRVCGLGGLLAEQASTCGRTPLWARSIGHPELDPAELAAFLDARGGSLGGVAGMNSFGLRTEFPAERLDDAAGLLTRMLRAPDFPLDEVRVARAQLREAAALVVDEPSTLAWHASCRLLFGDHPYALPEGGSLAGLARLGLASVRRMHRELVRGENLVFAVVGAVESSEVVRLLEKGLAGLAGGPASLPERPSPAWPRSDRVEHIDSDREQAAIELAWRGARFGTPDAAALNLAASILAGQGGRLFLELRDKRGLAYGVHADSIAGVDTGVFSAGMGLEPRRVDEGVEGLCEVIGQLAEEGPTEDELARNKRVVLGGMDMYRQRSESRAMELAYWERYGLDALGARAEVAERLRAVSAADVRNALADRLGARVEVVVS